MLVDPLRNGSDDAIAIGRNPGLTESASRLESGLLTSFAIDPYQGRVTFSLRIDQGTVARDRGADVVVVDVRIDGTQDFGGRARDRVSIGVERNGPERAGAAEQDVSRGDVPRVVTRIDHLFRFARFQILGVDPCLPRSIQDRVQKSLAVRKNVRPPVSGLPLGEGRYRLEGLLPMPEHGRFPEVKSLGK